MILLAGLIHSALARVGPSFALDYSAWHATNVVLVEITPSPGVFRVVESWKGDLEPGSSVAVPQLLPPVGAKQISSYPKRFHEIGSGGLLDQMPAQPVGSRLVLFLKKEADASGEQWRPADVFNEIKASVVWIDRGGLYCFRQVMNPGPTILVRWDMSLEEMKDRLNGVRRIQVELARVIESQDGAARAEGLRTYVLSDVYEAQQVALSELGKCGPKALMTIREMMADPAFADEGADLVKAFAEAGGESVGEELDSDLQKQLKFWQGTAPTLSVGWWNQDATPHAPLRERYIQTLQLVLALESVHYRPASATAEQLGSLWRSLPQLNDANGLSQMATECDKLVDHLRAN
ncbi:MAG TPA: hypothetical protein VGR55_18990 [Candidatus Acidoferrum sp.]|nr:hypothetical protein [Candidatus Acidoferrum sp.]